MLHLAGKLYMKITEHIAILWRILNLRKSLLFVAFTFLSSHFTDSRCRCGSNKDGKTQKEHFELLVKGKH